MVISKMGFSQVGNYRPTLNPAFSSSEQKSYRQLFVDGCQNVSELTTAGSALYTYAHWLDMIPTHADWQAPLLTTLLAGITHQINQLRLRHN